MNRKNKKKKKKEIGKVIRVKRLSVSITVQKNNRGRLTAYVELIRCLISYFISTNFLHLLLNKVEKPLKSQSYTTGIAVIKKCKIFKVTQAMPYKVQLF